MDQSDVGMEHAQALASKRGVSITTVVADLADYDLGHAKWAGIVAIWTHLPPELRRKVHRDSAIALVPGGAFVLEAYAPAHLERPGKGGPPIAPMLMSPTSMREELPGLDFELCQEVERDVSEGRDHNGPSTTTQVLAFNYAATLPRGAE